MKRVALAAILAIFAMNNYSYGQMLECKEGSNKKWGFVDETGVLIIPYKYEQVDGFSEGLAAVKLKGKWGFIDKNDKVVIPFKFAIATNFYEGVAPVMRGNGKWGFIDKSSTVVLPIKYASYREAAEAAEAAIAIGIYQGLDPEMLKRKGIIDETGTVVAPMKYTKQ